MSLKVVHIAREEDLKYRQEVKELAARLIDKWRARDLAAIRKIDPDFDPDEPEHKQQIS